MEIEDVLKTMLVLFQDIDKRLNELNNKQSEWDKKQDEVLHYIENHKLDAVTSCKIIKILKHIRYERRQIKDEIDVIRSLKNIFIDKYKNKFIMNILIMEDGLYYEPEEDIAGIKEEDIILYNDKEKLLQKILEVMEDIHKRESEEE